MGIVASLISSNFTSRTTPYSCSRTKKKILHFPAEPGSSDTSIYQFSAKIPFSRHLKKKKPCAKWNVSLCTRAFGIKQVPIQHNSESTLWMSLLEGRAFNTLFSHCRHRSTAALEHCDSHDASFSDFAWENVIVSGHGLSMDEWANTTTALGDIPRFNVINKYT